MPQELATVIGQLAQIEHGFNHIVQAGDVLIREHQPENVLVSAQVLLTDERYQARMLAIYLLGQISPNDATALAALHHAGNDPNWRVQEMLAKAFDHHCSVIGYESSLPLVKTWLADNNPNIVRAVIEGFRVWTGRPFFKDHPELALGLISAHRADDSEYVRKSVGNALRDIGKKHADLLDKAVQGWELSDPKVRFTKKLIYKNRE